MFIIPDKLLRESSMSDPSVADTPPSATSIVGIGTNPKRAKPLEPTGQDTADTRELIIFLTGLSAHVPGEEGNRFAAGIKNAMGKLGFDTRLAGKQVKNPNLKQDADQGDSDNDPNETATENRPGLLEEYTRTCVLVNRDASHDDRRRVRTIDVSELFWNRQLKAKLSTLPTRNRVIEGGRLLLYWLFSPRFLGSLLRGKNFLGLSIVGPAFLLVAWYWGVVAAGLTAIGSEGWSWIGAIAGTENLFPGLRAMAADLGKWMGGWTAWLATSTLIAAFGVNYAVDASYAIMRYLQNEPGDDGREIAERIEAEIADYIGDVAQTHKYTTITVVAYSFGSIPAIQGLARFSQATSFQLITLGAPLGLIAARSVTTRNAIDAAVKNPRIERWCYLYSKSDWLGTAPPIEHDGTKCCVQPLVFDGSWIENFQGKMHDKYFYHSDVFRISLALDRPVTPPPNIAASKTAT
jgi:hypothetical protein